MNKEFDTNDFLTFFAMILGMFMAVLDIQIVASSLSVISTGLNASEDEMSWVQTSYMIAEVIMIPTTGFLARCFSTRILYFSAILGFTIMSILCGMAWDINSMIIFRACQGVFGGVMIPSVFALTFTLFSGEQRIKIGIMIGLVVTLAPTLGPVIGGYITELISWRVMFYINLLPGIIVFWAVFRHSGFDKPNLRLLENFDFLGLILMALGLGTLEYMLEEGASQNWFESWEIFWLLIISVTSLILFVVRELSFPNPLIYFTAFSDRNFALGCIFSAVLGIGLFGVVYLQPLFLYRVGGLNTLQIGITMTVTGLSQFATAPIAGMAKRFMTFPQMLFIGLSVFGTGCLLSSFNIPDAKFLEFLVPQMLRGSSLMFCFIPIGEIVFSTLPKSQIKDASGLYNLMRTLGGAIGLAVINTFIIKNTKIFSSYFSEHIVPTDSITMSKVEYIRFLLEGRVPNADLSSLFFVKSYIVQNASTMAINNVYAAIGVIFICTIPILYFVNDISYDKMGR